jgi:ribonuclease BN (tRNA processing enzyme)
MHKLTFIGVGSAFAGDELGQSNMVIESSSGKKLMVDCGSRAQDMLEDAYGITNATLGEVDGVYISHLHADHIGGLEWLGLCTLFNPTIGRPKLYCIGALMRELWDKSLRGGMETLQVGEATLTTFFDCHALEINNHFVWEDIRMSPVQVVHVVSGFSIRHCYGLMIEREETVGQDDHQRMFLSGDTQYAPEQLFDFYGVADVIFNDCETTPFRSRVHAHYTDLVGLEDEHKNKMWLYHYNSAITEEQAAKADEDGFAGFVKKGQSFEF